VNLVIEADGLEGLSASLIAEVEAIRPQVQDAMAQKLASLADDNFNGDGPEYNQWPGLSMEYSTVVGRLEATLVLTSGESGRVNQHYKKETVPGLLRASTKVDSSDPDHSTVINDCDYAAYHQWGVRPFLPVDEDGTLTAFAEQEIRSAAEQAISDLLH
jgi:hypothetical protein